jgi:D-isomer specific 2-hydroxyacid dehydrogenase, NAD binding domain/D-isomer specific 2-hydroxyacid dehydrogenase, catalytic domain
MGNTKRARIYSADTWHVDDGVGTDGESPRRNPVRRSFSVEYKLAILAEYDGCSESGEKGAILRREGLYSSLIPTGVASTARACSKPRWAAPTAAAAAPAAARWPSCGPRTNGCVPSWPRPRSSSVSRKKCTRSWRRSRSADAVLNCYVPMSPDLTRELRGCRIIARYGIGLDTIDIPAATSAGILVTNVPDYCIDEVSDHALALILALGRGVVRLDRAVREGRWSPMDAAPLHHLRGRTLGLVGFGRIACTVAAKAAAVGLRVVAHDPFVADTAIAESGAAPAELPTLLASAHIVSVHAPLTPETRPLIGRVELRPCPMERCW